MEELIEKYGIKYNVRIVLDDTYSQEDGGIQVKVYKLWKYYPPSIMGMWELRNNNKLNNLIKEIRKSFE